MEELKYSWRTLCTFRNTNQARLCVLALEDVVPGIRYTISATVLDGEYDRDPAIFAVETVTKAQKKLLDAVIAGWRARGEP